MRHLFVSREFPPAPGGGIGTYASTIAHALAARGETVHVVTQRWPGADDAMEIRCDGRLHIHRLPYTAANAIVGQRMHPDLTDGHARALFRSAAPAQAFAWQAVPVIEAIVERDGIDVIEAQEYEAPLYHFQHRRALGLGPRATPPVVVHLHSPLEMIARHNGWPSDRRDIRVGARLEQVSILAADALIAPSRYLANQVTDRYGLDAGAVTVIPYPLGDAPVLDRTDATWEHGSILYVGRLEPRKGAEEWLAALPAIAARHPDARFVFAGNDYLTPAARRRLPPELRGRATFHGHVTPPALQQLLREARLVVTPSRWDNYPYACMEAMASGVAVLSTPSGGMAEMIEHGTSGWIAPSNAPGALADAASAILAFGPVALRTAGARASERIRQVCDAGAVVDRQLAWRDDLRRAGPDRSTRIATRLDWLAESEAVAPWSGNVVGAAVRTAIAHPGDTFATLITRVRRRLGDR